MPAMRSHVTTNQASKPNSSFILNTVNHSMLSPTWKKLEVQRKELLLFNSCNALELSHDDFLCVSVNGRVTTDFDETPPISTYLIAFIVSEFEYREFNATNGLPTTQRVFTSKDYINQTSYALIEGVTLLNAIGNYLQIPFVLQKLDHASIPYTWVGGLNININSIK